MIFGSGTFEAGRGEQRLQAISEIRFRNEESSVTGLISGSAENITGGLLKGLPETRLNEAGVVK